MRASEFIREEEKLDEVLPLVGAVAKAAGGAMARGAAAKGAGSLARGAAGMASKPFQSQTGDTIGEPDDQEITPADPARAQALDRAKDQVIKPGANVKLPTDGTGGPEEFKIAGMQGDEVEIENPNPAPGEPRKIVHKKDDIKQSMSL